MSGMKLGCDESGYDSDSTRTGADSPDCEKLNSKVRSGSITSEDYQTSSTISNNDSDSKLGPARESDENDLDETLKLSQNDPDQTDNSNEINLEPPDQVTPKKKSQTRQNDAKSMKKKNKNRDSAMVSLLDASMLPCEDTPPVRKVPQINSVPIPYYMPKRPRPEPDVVSPDAEVVQIVKRAALEHEFMKKKNTVTKNLFPVNYKTVKLTVQQHNLGLSIAEKGNSKTGFVISKIDPAGDAAKCGKFRLGDEIVRVCGKRVKRMKLSEAWSLIQNVHGDVEIYIGKCCYSFLFLCF